MPKSKRDKKISLTKTDKKGLVLKQKYIDDLQECVRNSNSIYVFTFINIRNNTLKEVRQYFKPSRIFIGKNKVARVALGKTADDEIEKGLHKLSKCLVGQCGLLVTDRDKKKMLDWFNTFSFEDHPRTGYKVDTTVSLKAGQLQHATNTMEPTLRALGMPVKLNKGVVTLLEDYEVCKEGQVLNPSQAKILQLLDMRLATMKFVLRAHWDKETGEVERFKESDEDTNGKMETDNEAENGEEDE